MVTVAACKSKAAVVWGRMGGSGVEVMLDSGSSVSLVQEEVLVNARGITRVRDIRQLQLVTASGDQLPILGHVRASIQLGELEFVHTFVVVARLVAPVIVGVDFLHDKGLVLDFTQMPVKVCQTSTGLGTTPSDACAVMAGRKESTESDEVDEYAVPMFRSCASFELPDCPRPGFSAIIEEYRDLFRTTPGATELAQHFIPTTGNPVRVPPRRIPNQFREEVEKQIEEMLELGIIVESSSPWMAPAVYVRKKSGDLRMCVDYRELNKKTVKDAYPLPLPDEVQDRLANSTIFSTLDLQSGYWQLPVNPDDREKTAFCPGPGLGLYEFCRMPFGLSGAPSSFQRLMDKVMRGLPFVTTYVDDILIHSANEEVHKHHLHEVFQRLKKAGLSLKGKKCHIGMDRVSYLGHVFSGSGMEPDPGKIQTVRDWPTPKDTSEVQQFLGLASYYRRYIHHFADIAAPLHALTQKGMIFAWTPECDDAFVTLKEHLSQAPLLAYPQFDCDAPVFKLQTDASAVGIGGVLEQGGHVIAYVSRSLTAPERNYSVIQRECLAVVHALKHFRHYLLGRPFQIDTDHAPLQWLSAQKMEGMLCRWALAIQEYDFQMVYRKGSQNGNADALSRRGWPGASPCAVTTARPLHTTEELCAAQQADQDISKLVQARSLSAQRPQSPEWNRQPFQRYRQLWHQLKLVDGVLCRSYVPGPASDRVTVPILPASLRQQALLRNHDVSSAGHQGPEKTLERLRLEAYWVNMAQDTERHCQECTKCQQSKLPMPQRAPLTNTPIGRPWQMVAVDVLEVPVSANNNRYLLVVQDYFTKWAEAIPMPDQTASRITEQLIKMFATFGQPEILHSDQGRNFESAILRQTLDAFGVTKSHTTAYHPQGDGMVERFNRSLLQLLRVYVERQDEWERHLPLVLYAYRTAVHTSTGFSPFLLMYGRQPRIADLSGPSAFEASSYPAHLRAKVAELRDFVEANLAVAAEHQKSAYDQRTSSRTFHVGETVWLSVPTAGKLDPKWEGDWKVQSVKGPLNVEITDGRRIRVVHINRLRHRVVPGRRESSTSQHATLDWHAPQVDHTELPPSSAPPRRYPQRERRPPDRYGSSGSSFH